MFPDKFRAWHKEEKAMIDWTNITHMINGDRIAVRKQITVGNPSDLRLDPKAYVRIVEGNPFAHPALILMASSGVDDARGQEIYHGDIIRARVSNDHEPILAPVEWHNGAFTLVDRWIIRFEWMEIIGNIYENPELLK